MFVKKIFLFDSQRLLYYAQSVTKTNRPVRFIMLLAPFVLTSLFLCTQVLATGQKLTEGEERVKKIIIPEGLSGREIPDADSRGGKFFSMYCSQCHNLPNPAMYSSDEWPEVFERMAGHAQTIRGSMKGIILPSVDEKREIISYLQKHGLKAIPENDPSLRSSEAFQFVWFCSTCHAAPDPASHTTDEWRDVVKRMDGYRKDWGRSSMTSAEMDQILEFLRQDSSR